MNKSAAETHRSSASFTRKYILFTTAISSALVILVFWGFNQRATRLIEDQLLHEARAFFQEIVQTRHWIIRNQGVYLRQQPSPEKSAIMAEIPGIKLSITDDDGVTYFFHNHAIVTDEISALGQQKRLFSIRLLSARPLNPVNAARDDFEAGALTAFAAGRREAYRFEDDGKGHTLRYLAPLFVTGECLDCHGVQGYRVGDVRGAIEVMIPADDIRLEMIQNRIYTIITAGSILFLLLVGVVLVSRHYLRDLAESEKKLLLLATTDPLTGLMNRREGLHRFQQEMVRHEREGKSLGAMILDIDRFKAINDKHGHAAGDLALKVVAHTIMQGIRDYDIVCRYGGEEFLIVLPGSDLANASETGERMLEMIRSRTVRLENGGILRLTASAGITALKEGDSIDSIINRADDAMYQAKAEGRDRVFVAA